MNRIIITSRVDSAGVLQLSLPVGAANADQLVQVTVEPALQSEISPAEWRQRILDSAGKWAGDFERPEQGEFEQREPLS